MIRNTNTSILAVSAIVIGGLVLAAGPGGGNGGTGNGNGGPPGGEEAGNNLSYPVIWSEGVAKVLRGTPGETTLDGAMYYWWGTAPDGSPLACLADPDAAPGVMACDDGVPGSVGPAPGPGDVRIVFAQQDLDNEWQAGTADWSVAPNHPDWIDWGDNLESVMWRLNSMVRTEVVLLQDLGAPCAPDLDGDGLVQFGDLLVLLSEWGACPVEGECPADFDASGDVGFDDMLVILGAWGGCPPVAQMLEYQMRHLGGLGQNEMWGLSTLDGVEPEVVTYDGGTEVPRATMYSPCARLTIQKLLVPRGDARLDDLVWEPAKGWREADGEPEALVNEPIFNKAAWEGGDGQNAYGAEINVKGRVIYGYTWNVRNLNEGAGDYRITFSLDELCDTVDLNTFLDHAKIIEPVEGEIVPASEGDGGGRAVIDVSRNLTYMDVRITQ